MLLPLPLLLPPPMLLPPPPGSPSPVTAAKDPRDKDVGLEDLFLSFTSPMLLLADLVVGGGSVRPPLSLHEGPPSVQITELTTPSGTQEAASSVGDSPPIFTPPRYGGGAMVAAGECLD